MKKLSIIAFVILCSLNSKAQITVSSSNLVGINNPNPLDALDVIGNPVFGTATERLSLGSGSLGFNKRVAGGTIYNTGAFAYQFQHIGSSTAAGDYLALQVYQPGGSLVTQSALSINGLGQVGIGTTNPSTALQVNGTVTATNLTGNIQPNNIIGIANGGTGQNNGSITGSGALAFTAGGTNQNITITPSGGGYTLFNSNVLLGNGYISTYGSQIMMLGTANSQPIIRIMTNGFVGVGYMVSNPSYQLDLGTASNSQIRAYVISPSDSTLKTNIQNLASSMSKLLSLQGKSYKLKSNAKTSNLSTTTQNTTSLSDTSKINPINNFNDTINTNRIHYGFLAQDVQRIYPDLVYIDKQGVMGIDYTGFIAIIAQSIREQNMTITTLQTTNTNLQTSNTSLQTQVTSLQSTVTNLQATITALQAAVTALQKKVNAL